MALSPLEILVIAMTMRKNIKDSRAGQSLRPLDYNTRSIDMYMTRHALNI